MRSAATRSPTTAGAAPARPGCPGCSPGRSATGARGGCRCGSAVREPAVAGLFYPGHPDALRRTVSGLLDAVTVPVGDELAGAYVVPHAGYRYSGSTAAHVFARLRVHADEIVRIVILGPAHRVPLIGAAVPATDRWRTPLGEVPIAAAEAARLVGLGLAAATDAP